MRHPLHLSKRFFWVMTACIAVLVLGLLHDYIIVVGELLLLLLLIAVIAEAVYLQQASRNITARRILPQFFSLHDANAVRIEIHHPGTHELRIEVHDEAPVEFQLRSLFFRRVLEGDGPLKISYDIRPVERGHYLFGDLQLLLMSKLGLVKWQKRIAQADAIKVYPSYKQMKKFEALVFRSGNGMLGIRQTKRLGPGYDFSHIRQYAIGDDPRRINAKASARVQKWMVNTFNEEKSQSIYALINTGRIMRMPFDGLSLVDYSVNSALALLNVAIQNEDYGGVITFSGHVDQRLAASGKSGQIQRIMDVLYKADANFDEANYEVLYSFVFRHIRQRSMLLLFTHFMSSPSLERVLPQLIQLNHNHLLVVVFFTNTELQRFREKEAADLEEVAAQTMASTLLEDQIKMARMLVQHGIQCIHTRPDQLSADVLSKYIELKGRGLI